MSSRRSRRGGSRISYPLRRCFQIGVGGGHDAYVYTLRGFGPHRLDLAGFERPQQVDLHLRRRLADLVQEQRAGVGPFEVTRSPPVRPGKSAACSAEELRGGEGRRHGSQVEREVRPRPARAGRVNGVRHQLLAGTGLASQQDRCGDTGGPPDFAAQEGHGGAVSHQTESLGLPGQGWRQEVKEQRHPVGKDDDSTAQEPGGGDLAGRGAEDVKPVDPVLRHQPHGAQSAS
jgi:hypothetical protein